MIFLFPVPDLAPAYDARVAAEWSARMTAEIRAHVAPTPKPYPLLIRVPNGRGGWALVPKD